LEGWDATDIGTSWMYMVALDTAAAKKFESRDAAAALILQQNFYGCIKNPDLAAGLGEVHSCEWANKNPFTISSFIHSKRKILQVLAVTWQPRSGGKKTIQVLLLHNYWTKQIAPSAIRIQSPSLLMVEEEQQKAQLSPEKQIIIFRYTLDMLKKWQSFYMKSFTVHAAQVDANYCYSLLQDIQILRFPCVSLHRTWERCMCQNTNR
jgi:hypothetical protein